jgi:CheY-like chemotaxis protein
MADALAGFRTPRKRLDMTSDRGNFEASYPNRSDMERGDAVFARVAIADDDPEALELLSAILSGPAVQIWKAAGGGELVMLLAEQGPFDLIVTDIDMPWMDGLAVLQSARAAEVRAPVLVVGGVSRPDLPAMVERLGNAKLVRKPICVSTLRKAVSDLLEGVS